MNAIKITNGFYEHKNIHKYTWIQTTRNLKSIIDYGISVIVRQIIQIQFSDVLVMRGATCGSDHIVRTKAVILGMGKTS